MPKLRRVHFASIGWPDARLSPLSLDLADDLGGATDSVLWLRNGGGKSSILNLFFSTFRPGLSDFLGRAVEGQRRHLADYVAADDSAFVLTEWELDAPSTDKRDARTLVVGQSLEWRDRVKSADPSRLHRRFFSFFTDGALTWSAIPLQGLGEQPCTTQEAFVSWLRAHHAERPAREVVVEDSQRKWGEHLLALGLDPELFHYQLKMNRREGAADELFRFPTATAFVEFFIELTLDTARAGVISSHLGEQRDRLALLPAQRAEQAFILEVIDVLGPFREACARLGTAEAAEVDAREQAQRVAAGLLHLRGQLEDARAAGAERVAAATEQKRLADNEARRVSRWTEGLTRHAQRLDLREAEAHEHSAVEAERACKRTLALREACRPFRALMELEDNRRQLLEQIAAEETARAPQRDHLERRGSEYVAVISRELDHTEGLTAKYAAERESAVAEERLLQGELQEQERRAARAEADDKHAREAIGRRDSARQRLTLDGLLDAYEDVSDAMARWEAKKAAAEQETLEARAAREELVRAREALSTDRSTAIADQATARVSAARARDDVRAAFADKELLDADPLLCEVEECERADAFANGVEGRLRDAAASADKQRMDSRIAGLYDEQAQRTFEETGLWPAPRDVDRVVQRLRAAGVEAFSGPEYLARNVRDDAAKKRALIEVAPETFFGVMVPADALARAREVPELADELLGPVAVRRYTLEPPTHAPEGFVVGPGDEAAFHHSAAARLRASLDERVAGRARKQELAYTRAERLGALASSVQRLVSQWGDGKLEAAVERADALGRELTLLTTRIERLDEEARLCRQRQDAAERLLAEASTRRETAALGISRLVDHERTHERELPRHRETVAAASQTLAEVDAKRRQLDAEIADRVARRDTARDRWSQARQRAGVLQGDRDGVAYRLTTPAVETLDDDAPPTLEVSAQRYRAALEVYEGLVSNDRLRGRLDGVEANHKAQSRLFTQALSVDVTRGDVESFSRLAETRLDDLITEAKAGAELASASRLQAEQRTRETHAVVRRLADRARDADDLPIGEDPPVTAAASRARAEELREQGRTLLEQVQTWDAEGKEAQAALSRIELRQQRAANDLKRMADSCDVTPAVPAVHTAVERDSEGDGSATVDDTVKTWKNCRVAVEACRAEATRHREALQALAADPRFADQKHSLKQHLGAPLDVLRAEAERYHGGLVERVAALASEIAGVERDRDTIVTEVLTVADEAVAILKSAERASRLPESLGAWGGQAFLRVDLEVPTTDDERRARLGPLVDELVQSGKIPGGLELAQRAVLRLHGSRSLRVTILKPEPSRRLERVDVVSMMNFSGGERLTAAVLLYCTLVRLRAERRGTHRNVRGNVLLLDNPIGTCSSVPLIELQREVAKAMGTQLIYTTGVDDLAALAQLPNVVRLRNVHRSQRGTRHVTLGTDEQTDGVVAARVVRRRVDA